MNIKKSIKEYLCNNKDILKRYNRSSVLVVISLILFVFTVCYQINIGLNGDSVMEASIDYNAYEVFLNDKSLGYVEDIADGEVLIIKAKQKVNSETKGNYSVEQRPVFVPVNISEDEFTDYETMYSSMVASIQDSLTSCPVKGYVIVLGNGTKVALESKEDVKKVLTSVESQYVAEGNEFVVKDFDNHGENTDIPIIAKVDNEQKNNLSSSVIDRLAMGSTYENAMNNSEQVDNSSLHNKESEETNVQEEQEENEQEEVEVIDVNFVEDVHVKTDYVSKDKLLTIEDAIKVLTNEDEKKEEYIIKKGDCLYEIAMAHDMTLDELLNMNSGMKIDSLVQIGDKLNISKPVPKLSVQVKERKIYTAPIERKITYQQDSSKYKNYSKTIDEGEDGLKEITENVIKVNGIEEGQEVVAEKVIKESKAKVVLVGTKALPPKSATGSFRRPLDGGRISSYYGPRWGGFHSGVDFAAPTGTPIHAGDGGKVIFAGWSRGYGYLVKISHENGFTTYYGHCSKLYVSVGQRVAKGETIAAVGSTGNSTGPHVHYEIRVNGRPNNPFKYIK